LVISLTSWCPNINHNPINEITRFWAGTAILGCVG